MRWKGGTVTVIVTSEEKIASDFAVRQRETTQGKNGKSEAGKTGR